MKVNGNAGAPVPVDGTTYNSDNIFGSGAQIGNSGWYCIYKGTGNQTSVTGLSPGTEYQVMVCEMNGNPANELYLSEAAQGNPGNFTTVSNDARLQTLGLSPFSLEPNFDPGVINYTATTTVSQPNVILTPVVKMPGSTITLNGNPVVNGSQTDLPLATGNNQIRIIVTAPDRITTKIYTIQILRRKSDQIITFNTLADKRVCDQEFDPGAVSNSGLPIVYTTSNPAVAMILPDGRIGITGAGRVTISANQPGNNNFNAAAPKIQTLTVNSLLVPTIRVTSSATGSVCTGVQITFTAVTTAGGSNPAYSWKVNGQPAGTGLSTFSSSSLEDGDLVSCTLTSTGDPCISSVPVNSTGVRVVISAPAQIGVTILASENPVTSGLPVTFRATSSGAVGLRHYRWRVNANIRGTDADRFTLSNPVEGDVITCELSTEAPCDVPVMSNNIILQVREEVKTVIPTTFSPNGDGINDYWRIRLHSNDRIHLSIFNRLGVIVYQSDAIEVSWDGSYKGKLLMPGTYYFVLTFAGSDKRLTGPVTLLY
jgi:gliding motility-associated-like protein